MEEAAADDRERREAEIARLGMLGWSLNHHRYMLSGGLVGSWPIPLLTLVLRGWKLLATYGAIFCAGWLLLGILSLWVWWLDTRIEFLER